MPGMLIAQISDMHVGLAGSTIDRLYHTADHLERAVAHVNRLTPRPDVVVATGDLVDRGDPAEYARLRSLLDALEPPCYLLPGNHDDRGALAAAFPHHAYLPRAGFVQYTVEGGPLRLVMADTLVPGASGGRLCAERLEWLDASLAEQPGRPTIVFMHHPPFLTGMAAMDAMGLEGTEDLAAVIRRHPHVERIACGHLHRAITRRFAGTVASTSPSTAHAVALDLPPAVRLAVIMDPPAVTLHLWQGEPAGLVSHLSFIGERPVHTVYDGERWLRDALLPAGFHAGGGR
jgi:3',5'-cyclic AMP phosphodiesterase CpdA